MRTTVAETIVAAMEALDLNFPTLGEKQKKKLEEARSLLTDFEYAETLHEAEGMRLAREAAQAG